jgi:hypothetical protein
MPSKDAVYWLNNTSEIAAVISNAVKYPTTTIGDWFQIVVNDSGTSSDNIRKELL